MTTITDNSLVALQKIEALTNDIQTLRADVLVIRALTEERAKVEYATPEQLKHVETVLSTRISQLEKIVYGFTGLILIAFGTGLVYLVFQ